MEACECIKTRRSIRGFRPDPVPRAVLEDVISTAQWSPSYKNSQPWKVMVLSRKKKEQLSELLVREYENGTAPCPDIPEPLSWPADEAGRIAALYKMRSDATGINFEDPAILRKAKIANFNFYRAPHAVYLYQEASLTPWSLFDLGLFAQSLMLAAHAKGLGTVPQAFATDYARITKEFLNIPLTKRLVLGISIGYPDPDSPANAFRTGRAGLDEAVTWVE